MVNVTIVSTFASASFNAVSKFFIAVSVLSRLEEVAAVPTPVNLSFSDKGTY